MSIVSRTLFIFSALFVILHVWAAFTPSYMNWGVHFFAFYPAGVSIVFGILALACFIPALQGYIYTALKKVLRKLTSIPTAILLVLTGVILLLATLYAGARLHLLGDGALLLRSIATPFSLSNFPPSFANQPFLFPFFWLTSQAINLFTQTNTELVYLTLDILAGIGFVILLLWYYSHQEGTTADKFLFGCLMFFAAGSQFFIGYIENYALPYMLTMAYIISAILSIERKVTVIIPLCFFFLMVGVNVGNAVLAPSLAILFSQTWKGKRWTAIAILGGAAIVGVAGLYAIGFKIDRYIIRFLEGSPDFLPIANPNPDYFPYSLFSLDHCIDWLNANLLIVPFSLIIVLVVSFLQWRKLFNKETAGLFLAVAAGCGLLFTWIINSSLGMPRDWDMLSSYFIPLLMLSAYCLKLVIEMPGVRNALVMITGLLMLHWASWVGVNAQGERHFARIEVLRTSAYLSLSSRLAFYDALSSYAYALKDYELARKYYTLYLEINELNPRILANISDIYRKLNMGDEYFKILSKAASRGTKEPGIYSNLGVEYMKRGDTLKSLEMNLKALALNPYMKEAHGNAGLVYFRRHQYDSAYAHIRRAMELGMEDPMIYKLAIRSTYMMNDYRAALTYCNIYLSRVPDDKAIIALRDQLLAEVKKKSQ